jgi:hypothetical protein
MEDRVPFGERPFKLGISPLRIELPLEVVGEKIGKSLPRLREIDRVADGHKLVLAVFQADDGAAQPLLRFPNAFLRPLLIENALYVIEWDIGGGYDAPVAALVFFTAATGARRIPANLFRG